MSRTLATCMGFLILTAVLSDADEPPRAATPEEAGGTSPSETAPDPARIEFFEKQIRPILANRCYKCHSEKQQKGELRLDSRAAVLKGGESGAAVVPGNPDKSELISAIRYEPDSYQMPPTGKLPDEEIAKLVDWVRLGAPWPDEKPVDDGKKPAAEFDLAARGKHWSLQPIHRPELPDVSNGNWSASPVDRFILSKLEQTGLKPSEPTDKQTLLRRITFDLIGLPPTTDELNAFVSDDSPDAFEKVVDRLLSSPHYGERWGRHWLDLVRFAETYGHEFDYEIPHAWRYRDYVVRAFNSDLPYDHFVVEHLAGDLLNEPRRNPLSGLNESVVGTGFYWFGQGKHSPVDIRAEECDTVDNQIDVLGKTFLGLTIACARCHDHKFDAITTRDYYALAGYLQSSRQQNAMLNDRLPARKLESELLSIKQNLRTALITNESEPTADRIAAEILESSAKDAAPDSPLLSVFALAARRDEFAKSREELRERFRAQVETARKFRERSIDLTAQTTRPFSNWLAAGDAFGKQPAGMNDWVPGDSTSPIREFVPFTTAHSGRLSPHLQGTLRSPTFLLDKPFIHYHVAREGGKENPGRPSKNGQIHLIVDGFQIIKDPLYGFLSLNVPLGGKYHWLRQDVTRFLGSRAYIEVSDDDEGSIAVDGVYLSDEPAAAKAPGPLALELLDDPGIADADQFAFRCRELITKTANAWRAGAIDSLSSPAERAEILSLLNRHGAFRGSSTQTASSSTPSGPTGVSTIVESITRYRNLESQFEQPQFAIAMIDGTPENEHLLVRGNHKKPGDEVPRRFLEVFGETSGTDESGSGRLALARRIASPSNPLTARVIVNRLWHHHFGRGLVPTTDDFGHMGQPPSHPELLDFLATELLRNEWSLKSIHRLMVLSSTYRMSSRVADTHAEERDPQNLLLHRMPVRRLEGEAIRDAMLVLSGRLDRRLEGPSVAPHLSDFMEGRGRPAASGPLDGDGRRSIYINVRRNFLTPFFLAFDYPTPLSTAGRRSVSNVPAQALSMMNNPFVVEQARLWAARTSAAREGLNTHERIRQLYAEAFGREPNEKEMAAAIAFLNPLGSDPGKFDDRAWADLCHALWNVKEFAFVR
ncbi:MAG: PSD1 and planctomycete cytochrome C domain-containing protein [Planctomycetaceae bacterium]